MDGAVMGATERERAMRQAFDQQLLRWFARVHLSVCVFHLVACGVLAGIELATATRRCTYVRTWIVLYMVFVPLYLCIQLVAESLRYRTSPTIEAVRYAVSGANGCAYIIQIIGLITAYFVALASSSRYVARGRGTIPCEESNPVMFFAFVVVVCISSAFLVLVAATGCFFFGVVIARHRAAVDRRNAIRMHDHYAAQARARALAAYNRDIAARSRDRSRSGDASADGTDDAEAGALCTASSSDLSGESLHASGSAA